VLEIDAEVKRIIDEGYERARTLIESHREQLELLAQALLEYETLDGPQVEEIVRTGQFTPPPPRKETGPPTGAQAATPLSDAPKTTPPPLDPGLAQPAPATA
jgi:cell division protease FtsH